MDMSLIVSTLITSIFAVIGTAVGAYYANKKQMAIFTYRVEQLEIKMEKHNQLIERVFRLEESDKLTDERIKVINHRLKDLEGGNSK